MKNQLSNIGLFELQNLLAEMAIAIAQSQGFNFQDVNILEYAQVNPRAAGFLAMAEAALQAVEKRIT